MLTYTGKKIETTVHIPVNPGKYPAEVIEPYLPDPNLIKAVNLAIMLKRPLLLMGEPGSGKTLAARAVAYELHHDSESKKDYRDFFYEWNIKSTSRAQDGLYEYDALRRLRDAQTHINNIDNEEQYIRYQALGKAIIQSKADQRPVVLIDEIDKADIDFPNDLLNEIDRGIFTVVETGKTYSASEKPIVIITSNRERELPEAFLRRCIYYFIPKFDKVQLQNIINRRFFQNGQPQVDLLENAMTLFLKLREEIEKNRSAGKNLSTSELIDWFGALHEISSFENPPPGMEEAVADFQKFIKDRNFIPLRQLLFKNWETLNYFDSKVKKDGNNPAV